MDAQQVVQQETVMAGMFTIDSHPALVLFDSGASHSFMSMGFVERHNLPLMAILYAYKIHTVGSQLFINIRTDTVSLVLATTLIIYSSWSCLGKALMLFLE